MASILSNVNIASGQTVRARHVTQSIDAFTGVKAYDISLSGSFNITGPINGEPLRINPLTSSYAITASYAIASIPFPYYGNATIIGSLGVTGESLFEGPIAGLFNTAIGSLALFSIVSGNYNIAIGFRSLLNNQVGSNNIAIGKNALLANINGNNNVVIGSDSQTSLTGGSNHIIIGSNNSATQNNNIIIGNNNSAAGSNNILLGNQITATSPGQLYIGSATQQIGTLIPGASWTAVINGVPVSFKVT
jgi:trimeric autotransporter adhesin